MKRILLFLLLVLFFGISSFGQKMIGYGAELSVLSLKPTARLWISKTTGFEVFGGIASGVENFNPNDVEVGFKYLHTIMYKRTDRTYFGFVGKWKWIDIYTSNRTTNLPVPGIIFGKEWYSKRIHLKGFAIEIGYQYGNKQYPIYSPVNHLKIEDSRFEEFPLIVNLRYTFYQKR